MKYPFSPSRFPLRYSRRMPFLSKSPGLGTLSQDLHERYVKSGMATRPMVTEDDDLDGVIAWGLTSDRAAVSDAMGELLAAGVEIRITDTARRFIMWDDPDWMS